MRRDDAGRQWWNGIGCALLLAVLAGCAREPAADGSANEPSSADNAGLVLHAPRPQQALRSPATITGEARGVWFAEGELRVTLRDPSGRTLGKGSLWAQSSPHVDGLIPFSGTLEFDARGGEGELHFTRISQADGRVLESRSFPVRLAARP